MEKQIVATDKAPAAVGPYSQAVRAGDFVFTAGQLGIVPGTKEFAGPDIEAQTRQALENLKAVLEAAGLVPEARRQEHGVSGRHGRVWADERHLCRVFPREPAGALGGAGGGAAPGRPGRDRVGGAGLRLRRRGGVRLRLLTNTRKLTTETLRARRISGRNLVILWCSPCPWFEQDLEGGRRWRAMQRPGPFPRTWPGNCATRSEASSAASGGAGRPGGAGAAPRSPKAMRPRCAGTAPPQNRGCSQVNQRYDRG